MNTQETSLQAFLSRLAQKVCQRWVEVSELHSHPGVVTQFSSVASGAFVRPAGLQTLRLHPRPNRSFHE